MKLININPKKFKGFNDQNLIIGHFNLIHYGHLELFKNLKQFSFLIFKNNPAKQKVPYTLEERINNLAIFNPQYIYVYDILANNISANDFINKILKIINPKKIIVGSDFNFGKNKTGNVTLLKRYFDVLEIKVNQKKEYSTSKIINLLEKGDICSANEQMVLKFYYFNKVVKGQGMGNKLNFPTANIEDNKNLKIKNGSYVSVTTIDNKPFKSISFIGIPKSFESINKSFIETHIFDFNQNIYGKKIKVFPISFIRVNQKFNEIPLLIKAINSDCNYAKKVLASINLKDFLK